MKLLVVFWFLLVLSSSSSSALPGLEKRSTSKQDMYHGIGTYYDAGPGSCGQLDTDDEMVVAVNKPQMHNGR